MDPVDTQHLLLIEDDLEASEMLIEYLSAEGFSVQHAADGRDGLALALANPPALLILDVMLPGIDGFEVLRQLRTQTTMPVLMLTARHDDVDRIVGLELGADDYLPKPYNPRELVARIRAILRRSVGTPQQPADAPALLKLGGLILSLTNREVRISGQAIELTLSEFNILRVLLANTGAVVSKAQLSQDALGRPLDVYDRSIDVHISHLRRKLAHSGINIRTVRAVGYLIEEA